MRSCELEELYTFDPDAAMEYTLELLRGWGEDRDEQDLPSDFDRWIDRLRNRARYANDAELTELIYEWDYRTDTPDPRATL